MIDSDEAISGDDKEKRGDKAAEDYEMKYCLMVDDNATIRNVMRRILEDLGFEVKEAEDGQKALDISREHMPDVVLVDWNMPFMDRMRFIVELRNADGGHRAKVLFCATENDLDNIMRTTRSGANEYVVKPFDREIIKSKFQELGLI